MGTINLSNAVKNPVLVGEVDFSLLNDLPSRFVLNPLQRSNRVNIRLRTEDISTLETLALSAGMPFQAFLADVIHKHANTSVKNS
ncbi:MAG: putative DNA binding CopG/RHH family protein [Pseudohongiellaceae bacterium]|jgi:predicted DNA binding CopG/RHH family protein|tara:strand:- start:3337 stop:3591 length:255 start_codon:yes stop_codon:yes gene_type:complete